MPDQIGFEHGEFLSASGNPMSTGAILPLKTFLDMNNAGTPGGRSLLFRRPAAGNATHRGWQFLRQADPSREQTTHDDHVPPGLVAFFLDRLGRHSCVR